MKNFLISFDKPVKYLLLILLTLSINITFSQNNLGLIKNINLPDNNQGGTYLQDIINADGYVFAYAYNRILVYDTTNNSLVGTVPLGDYGKYNPVYFFYDFWVSDFKVMAFNQSNHLLYVVSPDLKIFSIQTNSSSFTKTLLIDTPNEVVDAKTLHGRCNIKYDNVHNRLYWLLGTRTNNGSNPTGGFHVRDAYFAIYDLSNNANRFYLDFASNDDYVNMAQSFTFFESDNYFYVAKKKKIVIYQINNNNVSAIDTVKTANGKYSRLLTLEGSGVNSSKKVIALPYRFPFNYPNDYDPLFSYNVSFFVIDGVNFTCDSVISPSKRVIDGIIRNNDKALFLCFAPDTMIQDTSKYGNDVAIYQYNQNTGKYSLKKYINTNDTTDVKYPLSLNYPMYFTQLSDNTILLGKINTIIKFDNDNNSELRRAEGSFYARAAKTGTNLYFINLAKNGIDIFKTNNNNTHSQIKTAYPVYRTTANEQFGKLYFYNTLNGKERGVYVYNTASGAIEYFINTQNTVGDVVYNNYKNEVLISVSKPTGVAVKRYRGDNNQFAGAILISGEKHVKSMYISPDKRLYILTGMRNAQPELRIYNAETYQLITSKTITEFLSPQQGEFVNYRASFDYDKINDVVYMVISENYAEANPYFSVDNYYLPPIGTLKSLLIKIKNDNISTVQNNLNDAKKVICTYPYDNNGNQYTQLFINGEKLYLYNTVNSSLTEKQGEYEGLVYDEQNNVVYGFSNNNAGPSTGMLISLYEIDMSGNKQKIIDKKGQASAFFYNSYDGKLYFERKLDNRKLGETPLELYQVNTQATPVHISDSVSLINHGFYVEYDNYGWYNYHFVNLTTPYIDPYQNKIYLPNGGHSNVSVVSFTPDEPVNLHAGITWFSFPRLASRDGQGNENSNLALNNNIIPQDFVSILNNIKTKVENLPIGTNGDVLKSFWDDVNFQWGATGSNLSSVNSILGYKITLKPDENRTLFLKGTVEDPSATVDLKCSDGNGASHIDNWIGYFLYQEQNVFDALGTALDDIFSIQHQNYTCYRYHYPVPEFCGSKSASDYSPGTWICDGKPVIKYGDMIIVNTLRDIDNFQWHQTGDAEEYAERPQPEYYVYEEKPDYSTFVIELDTTQSNPVEIGAFVNDTCIGSTAVLATDSAVVLRGYLNGQNGDSVTFEEHYAARSIENKKIKEYYVINPSDFSAEKRNIKIGERKSYYLVSFNRKKSLNPPKENKLFLVGLYPNPASKNLTLQYNLVENEKVLVTVLDITGREVLKSSWQQTKGEHQSSIDTHKLKNGMYLLQLSAGNQTVVKRFLINR